MKKEPHERNHKRKNLLFARRKRNPEDLYPKIWAITLDQIEFKQSIRIDSKQLNDARNPDGSFSYRTDHEKQS